MKQFSIPARVGAGVVLWGVMLVFVWAIHPIESTATYGPVETPTAAEQASIDEVFAEFDGARPVLSNGWQCTSSPLQVATGEGAATTAPPIPDGFEYSESACSSAYGAARAAFWINLIAIGVVVAACIAIDLRLRRRPSDATAATASSHAEALVDS